MGTGLEHIAYPKLWQPENLEEAREIVNRVSPYYQWAAGTTLLRTQWEMGTAPMPKHLISLMRIQELRECTEEEGALHIGALTKLSSCANDEMVKMYFPLLIQAVEQISAPPIRNLATLGGNVVSGVGDSIPALLVYEGDLLWMTDQGFIVKKLADWLGEWRAGQRNAADILINIQVPVPCVKLGDGEREISFFRKIGRREAFTPSLVTIAFHGTVNSKGEWTSAKMAAGGGARPGMRLRQSEKLITQSILSELSLNNLAEQIQAEFDTYSDVFASENYRKQTAASLFVSELWRANLV